jgi:predicted RNase H-like HicB family nuclease
MEDDMKRRVYNFTVLLEQDEDGWYVAKVPDIQGCATQGKTIEEALERVKEAIRACLEEEKESPQPLRFVGVQQVEVKV